MWQIDSVFMNHSLQMAGPVFFSSYEHKSQEDAVQGFCQKRPPEI